MGPKRWARPCGRCSEKRRSSSAVRSISCGTSSTLSLIARGRG
jgi:hypothetical protein